MPSWKIGGNAFPENQAANIICYCFAEPFLMDYLYIQNAIAIANANAFANAFANAVATDAKIPDQRGKRLDCMEWRRSESPQDTGTAQYIYCRCVGCGYE